MGIILLLFLMIPVFYIDISPQSHQPPSSTVTTTTTTNSRRGDLFFVNKTAVANLVTNTTNIRFVESTGNLSYFIVRSVAGDHVLGLVYYTPDIANEWTYGYNSNVGVLTYIDLNGTIRALNVYRLWDSWSHLVTEKWVQTLVDRNVYEPLQVGKDFDGIATATRTSSAIVNGVREAGRRVLDDYHNTAPSQEKKDETREGFQAIIMRMLPMLDLKSLAQTFGLLGLWGSALLAYRWNDRRAKHLVMGAAVIFVGFYAGRMISIVDLTQLPITGLPPVLSGTYWYVLFGLTLVTSLIWGRVYCGYICPFGAFTQILHELSPFRINVPMRLHQWLAYLKYVLMVIVVSGVLLGEFWISGLEPFTTFFFSRGDLWMWVIVGGAILASVPAERFFCRYLCAAGAVLSIVGGLRVQEIRRWPECNSCLVCQRTCPTGAIVGPRISSLECINCRDCESNYLNTKMCPHYVLRDTDGDAAAT